MQGDGYLLFGENRGLANVRLPWLNALSFRTHQSSAVLMSVNIGVGSSTDPWHALILRVRIADGAMSVLCLCVVIMNMLFIV